MTKICHCNPLA